MYKDELKIPYFLKCLLTHILPIIFPFHSYEAWIIYNFMSLCLAYVGGPGAVEIKMQGVVLLPSWPACTCCLPPLPVNGQFVRVVKQGALQFVFVKPILAIITLALYATGHYSEGDWSPAGSFLWITIVYNITYTVALYALLLFYMGTHELLAPFRPLLKFILVKSVIFLTFWQGLFIAIAVGTGVVTGGWCWRSQESHNIRIENDKIMNKIKRLVSMQLSKF